MRCDYCGWLNNDDAKRCVKCNQELPEQPVAAEQPVVPTDEKRSNSGAGFMATVKLQSKEAEGSVSSEPKKKTPTFCSSCGYPFALDVDVCPACGTKVDNEELVEPEEVKPAPKKQSTKATVRDMRSVEAILASVEQEQSAPKEETTAPQEDASAPKEETPAPKEEKPTPVTNFKQTIRDFGVAALVSDTVKDDKIESSEVAKTVAEKVDANSAESAEKEVLKLTLLDYSNECVNDIVLSREGLVLNRENVDASNASIDETAHAQIEFAEDGWYISNMSKLNNTYILVNRKMKLEKGDVIVIGNKRYIFQ